MTRYRITFENGEEPTGTSGDFDAKDDTEAARRGRARRPTRTAGYEIWRDEGTQREQLVFAEWTLIQRPDTKR